MQQLIQDLTKGDTSVVKAPAPNATRGYLLINSTVSLISAGTERMLVDFSKAGYLAKARRQPDKVKMVLEKVQTDGLMTTIDAVRSKLDRPLPLGYCNVGVIRDVGDGVTDFTPGDRVVSNGPHADLVKVSQNLCAHIPDNVDDETAAFTVPAGIGLQGIRLARPTLGEAFVVIGVGLIGLLTVQLLRAHGCKVLAIDFDEAKLALAKEFGAETCQSGNGEDPVAAGIAFSRGNGVDGVIIAAATRSSDPVTQAARMSRKRGRIVLTGVTGLELSRADFYEKELSFQVSCSYGPGRYDPNYEDKGQDYPIGFVRWTEQRNFQAVLDMMAEGKLNVKPLISHCFAFEDASKAYQILSKEKSVLGILLDYKSDVADRGTKLVVLQSNQDLDPVPGFNIGKPVLGFIGAGNYASGILVPAFRLTGARLKSIASATGMSSVHVGKKNGIEEAATDTNALLCDPKINALVITTRHDSHAKWVCEGLKHGKHIFVEKPLALSRKAFTEIGTIYEKMDRKPILMVGFNRRFAPHVQKIKSLLQKKTQPKSMIMTVNAGAIPVDHWIQDRTIGGGRIIGEVCHFIDLLRFLADAKINKIRAVAMDTRCKDSVMIQIHFADGSIGTVNYLANGSKMFFKERLEVFCEGGILQLNNFRSLRGYGWPGFRKKRLWRQDKGQKQCSKVFVDAIMTDNYDHLIPFSELEEVTEACFDVMEQLS